MTTQRKKCQRKRNGIPGANTKQRRPRFTDFGASRKNVTNQPKPRSTVDKLLSRPLHESGRVKRMCRKLGIRIVSAGHTSRLSNKL